MSGSPLLLLAPSPGHARRLMRDGRVGGAGFVAGPVAGTEAETWRQAGFEPVPPEADKKDGLEFLHDMLGLADALALANGGDALWWATDLASRNRFESPLPPLLNAYAEALAALRTARARGRDLALAGLPWPVLAQVAEAAPGMGFTVLGAPTATARTAARLRGEWTAWRGLVTGLRESLRRIHAVRSSRTQDAPPLPDRPAMLLKSFAYPMNFDGQGGFRDPFFGALPEHLAQALDPEAAALTVCLGFGDEAHCARLMRAAGKGRVLPLEDFLRPADAWRGLGRIALGRLLRPFTVPEGLSFLGGPASTLLRECLKSGGWRVSLFQYLHRAAGRRLGRTLCLRACLTTFEANPWERMFLLGLRESVPGLFCLGFQHAVVPPAAAGVFATPAELERCPLPDRILTTGETPARLLRAHGAWPEERVRVACALRQELPKPLPPPVGPFTVLVALEGVREVLPLLRFALEQASGCTAARFVVRTHPLLPLPLLLADLGAPALPANVAASQGGPLLEDMAACHAVLYWGTTVSMEALALGRPAIHFDNGMRPSFDPLAGFDDFRWTVGAGSPLAPVLEGIRALSPQEAARRAALGREHVLRFFAPQSPEALAAFHPPGMAGGTAP